MAYNFHGDQERFQRIPPYCARRRGHLFAGSCCQCTARLQSRSPRPVQLSPPPRSHPMDRCPLARGATCPRCPCGIQSHAARQVSCAPGRRRRPSWRWAPLRR
eukprot:6186392-Pleurochrysis_carterae.AAC.2